MIRFIPFSALALLMCGAQPAWAQTTAWPDCAPWDGAATRIAIPRSTAGDSASPTTLSLALYASPEAIRGRSWTISDHSQQEMSVTLCPPGGPCTMARSGSVRVDSGANGSAITGQFRVRLADGRLLTGHFSAPLQQRTQLCG